MKRYHVKYETLSKLNEDLAEILFSEIKEIYKIVNDKINSYAIKPSERTPIVITGSGAILYYIKSLGYNDLINQMDVPSDVDLLMLYDNHKHRMKPKINSLSIGDFKLKKLYEKNDENETESNNNSNEPSRKVQIFPQTTSDKKSGIFSSDEPSPQAFHCKYNEPQSTSEPIACSSSETFINYWENRNIRSFDLTIIPISSASYNTINDVNLLDLQNLKSFYEDDLDLASRNTEKDYNKIKIIQEIIDRLNKNPRNDLIFKAVKPSIGNKRIREPFNYNNVGSVNYHLYDSQNDDSILRPLDFDAKQQTPSPVKKKSRDYSPGFSSGLIPMLDFDLAISSDSESHTPRTPILENSKS